MSLRWMASSRSSRVFGDDEIRIRVGELEPEPA
jgi:hypothetical protein